MTPQKISRRVVANHLAWISNMLTHIRALPLALYRVTSPESQMRFKGGIIPPATAMRLYEFLGTGLTSLFLRLKFS